MRVERLEVFGFKSFMERLVLPLEGGVTGVVGPNGCGKSNIVDALRWVLGETRASNLRGELLEDIIFNGTDKLRPLGLAEVTLTLRSSGPDLFSDLVASFKDEPAFLASDVPLSIEPSTLIEEEQSPVEPAAVDSAAVDSAAVDSAAVEDSAIGLQEQGGQESAGGTRPQLTVISGALDEAPDSGGGVKGLQNLDEIGVAAERAADPESAAAPEDTAVPEQSEEDAQKEAAARAGAAQTFFTRFSWLKSVSEVQITRRIYRSGESEFFINRAPCRLKDLKDLFRAVGLGARAHTIVAQGEVGRIVTAKPEERRLVLEEAAGVLGFRDKIAAANRRLEETGVNISRIDDIVKEVSKQVSGLKRQAARARNRKELKDRIRELEKVLYADSHLELEERHDSAQSDMRSAQDAEMGAIAAQDKAGADEQKLRGDLLQFDVEGDELRLRVDALREEINNRERRRDRYGSRIGELRAFTAARSKERDGLAERHAVLAERCRISSEEIASLELRESEIAETMRGLETAAEEDLLSAQRGLDEARKLLKDKHDEIRTLREQAISAESALKTTEAQLVAISPLTHLRELFAGDPDAELFENVRILSDGIEIEPRYTRALQAVLGEKTEFLVCPKAHDVGRAFVRRVAAEQGADAKGIGVLQAGDVAAQDALQGESSLPTLMSLVRTTGEVAAAVSRLLAGVYVGADVDDALRFFEAQPESQATVVTLGGDLLTRDSFTSLHHEGGTIQLRHTIAQLSEECRTLVMQQRDKEYEAAGLEGVLKGAEARQEEALRMSQERQSSARELGNQLGNVRGRLQAERKIHEQAELDSQRVSQQIGEIAAALDGYLGEIQSAEEELLKLVPEGESELRGQLETMLLDQRRIDQSRSEGRNLLSGAHRELERVRNELDRVKQRVSDATLELQKIELERGNLRDRMNSEYGEEFYSEVLSAAASCARIESVQASEYREELLRLKNRIVREGDVDPTSIERCEEEERRLEELERQRADLEQAASTLKKTIARLMETSERRFIETFNAVRKNFSKLMPRLWGGGKADLVLLDPSKPLESGIDIAAKPPGKKLKAIDLLSGGEKALCATALIFSMFLERPSPLCVLDEVDAPLDDANLVRFLSIIKEMSAKTQFLVVTHNKHSMAVADNLVGVTMQEPGASKVITVSLQEAYSQVA